MFGSCFLQCFARTLLRAPGRMDPRGKLARAENKDPKALLARTVHGGFEVRLGPAEVQVHKDPSAHRERREKRARRAQRDLRVRGGLQA